MGRRRTPPTTEPQSQPTGARPRASREKTGGAKGKASAPDAAEAPGVSGLPAAEGPGAGPAPGRVLIVSGNSAERERLCELLTEPDAGLGVACTLCATLAEARRALAGATYEVALVRCTLSDGAGTDLARELSDRAAPTAVVLMMGRPTLEETIGAMRSGAADVLSDRADSGEVLARVQAALERTRRVRGLERRHDRLRRLCRKLNSARREVTEQVGSLCDDLTRAYQEMADQLAAVAVAGEFGGLVRQELDVEGLLRTAMEYLLAKAGPTNAAVFLPSSSCDFSLGAYINYDCPKDAGDVLLEHLAGVIAPRVQDRPNVLHVNSDEDLRVLLGDDADWLDGSDLITFSCRHEEECLAVVVLFRERGQPYPPTLLPMLRTIADLFGQQLARVIRIHHRHLPRDQWGQFDAEGGADDIDLAA